MLDIFLIKGKLQFSLKQGNLLPPSNTKTSSFEIQCPKKQDEKI